jgi:hypothetical protein
MSRNPNIEDPTTGGGPRQNPDVDTPPGAGDVEREIPPIPPDREPQPPVETPPDQPGKPDRQPDPPPIGIYTS